MSEDTRTIGQLAQECLDIQDACNLSGVVLSFSKSIMRLRELERQGNNEYTGLINTHCICKLWADKISSLTNTQNWSGIETNASI